jgi:hypothetical protein
MDDEKFERQKEFILEQQAQFAAKIGQLEENLGRQAEAVERLNQAAERQGENIGRLAGVVERVVDTVARLVQVTAERFEAVDRRADETDRSIAALVDAQIRAEGEARKRDEAMRKLAETLDQHAADGHGGKEQPGG